MKAAVSAAVVLTQLSILQFVILSPLRSLSPQAHAEIIYRRGSKPRARSWSFLTANFSTDESYIINLIFTFFLYISKDIEFEKYLTTFKIINLKKYRFDI